MRLPETFEELSGDSVMTNFGHTIDAEIIGQIKGKPLFSRYAGWNFNGKVWWQDDQWHCEVWVYKVYQETVSADTLEEIMEQVSNEYGAD